MTQKPENNLADVVGALRDIKARLDMLTAALGQPPDQEVARLRHILERCAVRAGVFPTAAPQATNAELGETISDALDDRLDARRERDSFLEALSILGCTDSENAPQWARERLAIEVDDAHLRIADAHLRIAEAQRAHGRALAMVAGKVAAITGQRPKPDEVLDALDKVRVSCR